VETEQGKMDRLKWRKLFTMNDAFRGKSTICKMDNEMRKIAR
jgi:hypothetical protein